jgi:hypothetical protein
MFEIKKTSTLEENVSLRTISYEVWKDGEYVTHFNEYLDAEIFVAKQKN